MKLIFEKIKEFYNSFLVPYSNKPTLINYERAKLRHKLMSEENDEYLEACKNNDLVEVADGLTDQLYILVGTMIEHGLQDKVEELFLEVHRSNMSKLDENGKPILREDGKIIKSFNYTRPYLKPTLDK